MNDLPTHVHRLGVDDLAGFEPGAAVQLPSGRPAVVLTVDRERGEVQVEAVPWRANFRATHLRLLDDDERSPNPQP